jgi:hypothetical protein
MSRKKEITILRDIFTKGVHYEVLTMLEFIEEEEDFVFAGKKGEASDTAFEMAYEKQDDSIFYRIKKIDLELAYDLNLGVVCFNDNEVLPDKIKNNYYLFNAIYFSDRDKEEELLRVVMYMQLTEPESDYKKLDKILQNSHPEELRFLFENNAWEHLDTLNEIFSKKKKGLILEFN